MSAPSAFPVEHGQSTETVVARALVAVGLSVLVGAIFFGVVFGVGVIVGVGEAHLGLRLAAAGAVAVAFEPARGRLASGANRLVFGQRDSPWEAVGRLAAEMAVQDDPSEVLRALAAVTRDGTGAGRVVVWLRVDGTFTPWATSPDDGEHPEPVTASGVDLDALGDADLVVPIRDRDETLGAITVTGWGDGPRHELEARMADDLAAAASIVTRTVHLRALRQRRLDVGRRQQRELSAARAQTVATQLAARQLLERDIHDTCQQRAVALLGKLGLAGGGVADDPTERADVLAEIEADIDRLTATLAEVSAGRLAADLLDQGLGAALRLATMDAGVQVDVEDEGARSTRAVEEALFTCGMEAIQNAAKHAAASRVVVRVHRDADRLVLRVDDDGIGFDPTRCTEGRGMQHMRDRLTELGGQLSVQSWPGGSRLTGWVPAPEVAVR